MANTASGTFTAWFFIDVLTGPSPEFVLLIPVVYGPISWGSARVLASLFEGRDASKRAVDDAAALNPTPPATTAAQILAWRAYRDAVLRP